MSETFVDQPQMATPPQDTWKSLSYGQLLEVKSSLLQKMSIAGSQQMYLKPLSSALQYLEALLETKLNDPRGFS